MSATVVIADDDETIRAIVQHKLSAAGFDLHVCKDGEAARTCLDDPSIDPDIAILDVMMPRLQ